MPRPVPAGCLFLDPPVHLRNFRAFMTFSEPASYYAATALPRPLRPALEGTVSVDVAIVGGGFTGLSAALELAERGYKVALLEAATVGWGASGRNGGQVNTGYRKGPGELVALFGRDQARRLWALAEEAKQMIRDRVARHAIACDLKPGSLYAALKEEELGEVESDLELLQTLFAYNQSTLVDRAGMAQRLGTGIYRGGLADQGAMHLHPLNYALGLAAAAEKAGATIHEDSRVAKIDAKGHGVETAKGRVTARFTLVACNAYLEGLVPALEPRILPISNYIIATEPLGEARARALIRDDVAVCDSKFVVNYYRLSADHRMLFGGGEVYTRRDPGDIKRFVRPYMLKVYPQLADARIDYGWGGRLAVTMSRLPDIGRIGGALFYAQGYSGQGVALTGLAGRVIAEAIAGTAERFDIMARIPHRAFPGGPLLRHPAQILGMLWYALRDRF
jgi:gamma-glutamylputrescine oxidase